MRNCVAGSEKKMRKAEKEEEQVLELSGLWRCFAPSRIVTNPGTISPVKLKKLRRCGFFDLSGPIIYQRL
jgi:hypothetical protein